MHRYVSVFWFYFLSLGLNLRSGEQLTDRACSGHGSWFCL